MKMTVNALGKELSIPGYMQAGLEDYVNRGYAPGDFLSAVLKNDLARAVQYADNVNLGRLVDYVYVLYNNAPGGCWGSPERFHAWIEKGGLEGIRKEEECSKQA